MHDSFPVLSQDANTRSSFQIGFDRTAFPFLHSLHATPCFQYQTLLDMTRELSSRPTKFYIEDDDTEPGRGWNVRPARKSLYETLQGLADCRSFVMLKRVHEEPAYQRILETCTDELSQIIGIDMRRHYRDGLMTIIITSPHRVTPYHIDSEVNLLMQMQGKKAVFIFDGNDRQVLPATELERFWSGDLSAATYREELQSRAWRFDLVPGMGVCNPVIFPHWVKNGPDVSISLSLNYKRVSDDVADAFRVNHRLRGLGLHPVEPGKDERMDHTKGLVYRTFRNVKHTVDGFRHKVH